MCANCSLVELLQLAIIHSMPCVVPAGVPVMEYTHIDLLVPVPLEQVVQDPCLMQITQLNLKGWKVAPQSLLHPPHAHTQADLPTMSSTPSTLVGCITLTRLAFLESTQCSLPSSSTNCSWPVSEYCTTAPTGTSNSPPLVLSSQTCSPCRDGRTDGRTEGGGWFEYVRHAPLAASPDPNLGQNDHGDRFSE